MALVEQALGCLDHRGDDPRPRDDAAHRADRAAAGALGDLADLELELRRTGQGVAALVHRRRTGMGGLAAEGDLVALDAERPEHDAERQVQRLEHRPLLDVQLEIGRRPLQLRARLQRPVELDPVGAQRVGQRHPVGVVPLPQLVLVVHRATGGRRAEERAAEARALLVGPVDEPHRHSRLPVLGEPPHHLDPGHHVQAAVEPAAVRHRVDVAADQHRPVSDLRRAASTTGCPPRRARTRAAGRPASRAATPAPRPRCPSRRLAARRSRRRSARAAPSARRRFSRDPAARRDANPLDGVW